MTCDNCKNYAICINGGFAEHIDGNAENCRDFVLNKRAAELFLSEGRLVYIVTPSGEVREEHVMSCERKLVMSAYTTSFITEGGMWTENDLGKSVFLNRLDARVVAALADKHNLF